MWETSILELLLFKKWQFHQQQCTIAASAKLAVPTEISYVENMSWYQYFSTLCMQRKVKEDGAKITSELVWPF